MGFCPFVTEKMPVTPELDADQAENYLFIFSELYFLFAEIARLDLILADISVTGRRPRACGLRGFASGRRGARRQYAVRAAD
jgi:hypothetical protein